MLQHDVTPEGHKIRVARQNFLSREKVFDKLFECLRHNHLSLRQVPMMWRHKPDLLLLDHKQA